MSGSYSSKLDDQMLYLKSSKSEFSTHVTEHKQSDSTKISDSTGALYVGEHLRSPDICKVQKIKCLRINCLSLLEVVWLRILMDTFSQDP